MDGAADDPVPADTPISRIGEEEAEHAGSAKEVGANEADAASSELPEDMTQNGVVFPEGDHGNEDARRDVERGG